MNLYLVQHALAKSKDDDPNKPLSDRGKRDLLKVMAFLDSHRVVEVETIYHSGKLRAEQTAMILAESIKPNRGIEEVEWLAPMDDPAIWAGKLAGMHEDVMLVGHLPYMSKLASLLLTGDQNKTPVLIRNAGIVCLNRDPGGHWAADWIIVPEILS
jgi:phosphohistidine phosphatase